MIKRMCMMLIKRLGMVGLAGCSTLILADTPGTASPEPGANGASGDIIFAAWTGATEPFAPSRDPDDGRQGLIRDVGDLLADALHKQAVFKPLPGGRIQVELLAGRVDLNCLTSPKWWVQPREVKWTIPLFEGGEGPIVRADMAESLNAIEDLEGKTVSLYHKYDYDYPLKKLIDEKRITVLQVDSLDKALSLLELGRTDAHIEFTSVSYRVLENPAYSEVLKVAPLRTDTFGYSCAVADSFAPHLETLNAAIRQAQQSGELRKLLRRYNFPQAHPASNSR